MQQRSPHVHEFTFLGPFAGLEDAETQISLCKTNSPQTKISKQPKNKVKMKLFGFFAAFAAAQDFSVLTAAAGDLDKIVSSATGNLQGVSVLIIL